jgi:O-antigen/teichoic acid export membrane protein
VKDGLAKLAGTALLWRAIELAGVKIIFLVRLLILARLLSPDDFGLLAIAMTAIGFLLSITDFGMVPALVQRSELNKQHYNAAWTVIVVRAAGIAAIVFLAAPLIANVFNEPRAIPILQVLSIRPLLEASASIRIADLIRDLEFRSLAFVKLSEGVINTIIAIGLARYFGVWALVWGALAGTTAYLVMSYLLAPHRPSLLFDFKAIQPLIRFGRWIFLTGLIAVFGGLTLRVVISRQLGTAQLGLYFLAASLAFLPSEVATKVAGYVAFPLYARLQSDIQQATRAFRAMLTGMSAILFPVCFLIIVLAPSIVQNILGPRWEGTVPVIRILALISMIGVLGEATVPILKGLGQPYKVTMLETVQSLLIIIFVWGLASRYGLIGAVLAWLPAILVSQLCSVVFMKQILWKPFTGLKTPMVAITAASLAGAMIALVVDNIIPGISGFVMANLIALITIGTLLWVSDRRFALGLVDNLGRIFPQVASFIGYSHADR